MRTEWKSVLLPLFIVALTLALAFVGMGQEKPEIKNPDTLVVATYGSADTLDPSYSYDTSSSSIINNIYETLLQYPYGTVDADERNTEDYSVSDFEPLLATKVPTKENGLVRETEEGEIVYEFPIREGVKFHNGNALTPEDVEYSIERTMIFDVTGGPSWMLLTPLTNHGSMEALVKEVSGVEKMSEASTADLVQVYRKYIDPAVEVKGDSVVFTLPDPYPPFMNILTMPSSWASIMDKEWVVEQGGWPGTAETWIDYHDPGGGQAAEEAPLYDKAMGTGPFKLERWQPGQEVVFSRNEDYWREPAQLKKAIWKKIDEWGTRRLEFVNGDADILTASLQRLPQLEGTEGVVIHKGLPTISMNPVMFYVQSIDTQDNDLVGCADWGCGIPADFFADVKVRKAFNYAFEYKTYIEEVTNGQAYMTNGPVPKNMEPFYNDEIEPYTHDLEKAEQLLKEAHGGTLWEEGFTFTILYNKANEGREISAQMIEANIEKLNPKFEIKIRGIAWASILDKLVTARMPIFTIGWIADFPDPHNFVKPFMSSEGTFSKFQGEAMVKLAQEEFDPLIDEAMATIDTEKRKELYYELQEKAHDLAIDLWLPQPQGHRQLRTWVQNVPFNPMLPYSWSWMYPITKGYE